MFSKETLLKIIILGQCACLFESVVYPVDCAWFMLNSLACKGIVLHDFTSSNLAFCVYLPKDDFFVFGCSKGVFIPDGAYLFCGEELTKKADKVTFVACRAFDVGEWDCTHWFCWLFWNQRERNIRRGTPRLYK